MSYRLLRELYLGATTNAELSSKEELKLLHVKTGLEDHIEEAVRKKDVILTGNPGDGKTHLVRKLQQEGRLEGVVVELDLSARRSEEVIAEWRACIDAEKRFLLCANEGPLVALMEELKSEDPPLGRRAVEIRSQLGRLTVSENQHLPPLPTEAELIDLADRNILDEELISKALERVCRMSFLPSLGLSAIECSVGRNLTMLSGSIEARERVAKLIVTAGRRRGKHVTFRQLWAAISFAITGGRSERALKKELEGVGETLGTNPIDFLVSGGRGGLLEAANLYADPASVTSLALDEALWTTGKPEGSGWLVDPEDFGLGEPSQTPVGLWREGARSEALMLHRQLKRQVAFAHREGRGLVEALASETPNLNEAVRNGEEALDTLITGLRRMFLTVKEERRAPLWLRGGLPLWVSNTYRDVSNSERCYVATSCLAKDDFELRTPVRPIWLSRALGPLPNVLWVLYKPESVALRIDAELFKQLDSAAQTSGPLEVPDRVVGFLARLASVNERMSGAERSEDNFAVLGRPRGSLVATGRVQGSSKRASYA